MANFTFRGTVPEHIDDLPNEYCEPDTLSLLTKPRHFSRGEYICIASGIADMATFRDLLTARIAYIEPIVKCYGVSEDIFFNTSERTIPELVYRGTGHIYVPSTN